MNPRLSVVIPVYDNWWLTARALRALDALRDRAPAFETIVVDNGSRDETPEAIQRFEWARYERFDVNRNFAGACNAGARLARAPVTLFLNNDAFPLDDAFSPILRTFERDDVTIAGGALFFEDGVTQCAGLAMLPNAHWHYSCRNLPPSLEAVTQSRDALGVSGAAMAVRTQAFLDVGGFDEAFVNGFEDVDLCMRVRERGGTIAYVADARFVHYEAASAGRYAREAENERRFYRRWSPQLAAFVRTGRGNVGAVAVRAARRLPALEAAALRDLQAALAAFGHPLVAGNVRAWQRLDARFRADAAFEWFAPEGDGPGVKLERCAAGPATLRTRGASELRVAWLPCADVERAVAVPLRTSPSADCETIAVAGLSAAPQWRRLDLLAALETMVRERTNLRLAAIGDDAGDLASRFGNRAFTCEVLAGGAPVEIACVVHAGLTDRVAYGNVLLAQSELPAVVAGEELHALFAPDVAAFADGGNVRAPLARLLGDVSARLAYASSGASDARRRFSPRRSAMRVVDLLCAARFGLERPAAARSNTPL